MVRDMAQYLSMPKLVLVARPLRLMKPIPVVESTYEHPAAAVGSSWVEGALERRTFTLELGIAHCLEDD